MERRDFVKSSIAAFGISLLPKILNAQSDSSKYLLPKALNQGDTIAVIAPGTSVSDPDSLYRAKESLDYFGLNMKLGDHVIKGSGYKSRSVHERLDDIHNMFKDPEVSGIFCVRGGYGSGQLLDKIDYDLIARNPKVFLGYSDITAMHLAINKYSKLVTFHGPVLLSTYTRYTIDNFQKAIFSSEPIGMVMNPQTKNEFRTTHPLRTIRKGKALGRLVGGNLSIICSLMGTPYEIDTIDKILFIEDVGEEPYRIDRMLTQLRLAGKFAQSAGIIIGECTDCNKESMIWDYSLGEIYDLFFGELNIPVISGYTIGHGSDQLTLPLGIHAELDTELQTLNIIEACVR